MFPPNPQSDPAGYASQVASLAGRQAAAAAAGDLLQVRVMLSQLRGMLPGMAELLRRCRSGDIQGRTRESIRSSARAAVEQMQLARQTMSRSRDQMAQLLQEIHHGRRMLANYRPMAPESKVFEIVG